MQSPREQAPDEDRAEDVGQSPLSGCCGAVAIMVYGCFGGEIMQGDVDGYPHFWNRLPNGHEVDLTSCQFGGDGYSPIVAGEPTEYTGPMDPPYLHFAALVLKKIGLARIAGLEEGR